MSSRNMLFRAMYRIGFTPWDGHPIAKSLHDLVEGDGSPALPAATALDIGCGTGDASIYLAQHGWQVTGVDFVPRALAKARAKAQARQVTVNFVEADVTRLSSAGVGTGFALIVDNGCLHNLTDHDRDAYVREVSAVAAPHARLLIGGLDPGEQFGVQGITQAEIERRFTPAWTLVSSGDAPEMERFGKGHYSLLSLLQPRDA
jgi:SAM-dependent methyltransferase